MMKPEGYDFAKEERPGVFLKLPAGAYTCKIAKAEEMVSNSGREMIRVSLDIADGEYANFFKDQYAARKKRDEEAKWPCFYYQMADEQAAGRLKGFLSIVAESNPRFTVQWGDGFEESLRGQLIGGVFREEEYIGTDNKVHTSVKCAWVIPTSEVETTAAPEPKKLEAPVNSGFGAAAYDDIPF